MPKIPDLMMKKIVLLILWTAFINISLASHLSHVVIPFHKRQVDMLMKNIQSWSRYQPCEGNFKVGLIFFVSGVPDESLRLKLKESVGTNCFDSINVEFAGLEGDQDHYLKGTRIMFEQMISKSLNFGEKKPSHVFYMEPDCLPIRPNWLHAINKHVIPPNAPFWMKGSVYRGHAESVSTRFLYNHVHINGNAIYNIESDEFKDFYSNLVSPLVRRKYNERNRAYDTDIFKLLFWNNARNTAQFFHKFQFSDFIQNHWHSEYSFKEIRHNSPDTFLVHGGHARE